MPAPAASKMNALATGTPASEISIADILRNANKPSFKQAEVFKSLPLEGKVPSANTGRMRWKSCIFDGKFFFLPVPAATSSVSLR